MQVSFKAIPYLLRGFKWRDSGTVCLRKNLTDKVKGRVKSREIEIAVSFLNITWSVLPCLRKTWVKK